MEHEVRNMGMETGSLKAALRCYLCAKLMCSKILHLLRYMAKSTNHKPWCLLDDLLVPPLNGAFSLIEVDLEVYDDDHVPYSCYGYMC